MGPEEHSPLESRPPTKEDFIALCKSLNDKRVDYIVVGGMAIIQHGYLRATEDIDLLVDAGKKNEKRLIDALSYLPDKAVRELKEGDIEKYTVVRVADEIVIDLMKSACGIDYSEALKYIEKVSIEGISIPFANLDLMWRMKQTVREKDKLDQIFIREQLGKKKQNRS